MFGYAFSVGASLGLAPVDAPGLVLRAWSALARRVSAEGALSDICAGTGQSPDADYYLARPRVVGDLHGQAALLWLCHSLLGDRRRMPANGRS
jgi:rhamnogalacturonyl hydrolase YesR